MYCRSLALGAIVALWLAGPVCAQGAPAHLRGSAVPSAEATRTITITPDTRFVNAMQGETIRFLVGGAEFTWRFDGPVLRPMDLQEIAPTGLISRPLTVYLARQPAVGSARP